MTASDWKGFLKPAIDKTVWPDAGKRFLVLAITVCNLGDETSLLAPPRLLMPDGTVLEPTTKVGPGPATQEPLTPDRHYERQFIFEVTPGKPYKVQVSGGWLSDRQAVVEIRQ